MEIMHAHNTHPNLVQFSIWGAYVKRSATTLQVKRKRQGFFLSRTLVPEKEFDFKEVKYF